MFSILLLLFLLQLSFVLFRRRDFRQVRRTFVEAFVLTAVFIVATTETLSLFDALNSKAVTAWWTAANALLLVYGIYGGQADLRNDLSRARAGVTRNFAEWVKTPLQKMYFLMLALVYAVVFVIAVAAPPNTLDSLAYHLARVAHWIQAGNVDHYPTAILRQLYQNPLAEYAILQLQILSGGDQYANLVQFFSLIACGAVVSLIVGEFGQDNRTQLLSALLTATIPMAILQASSTQNDLVLSFFTAAFFYFFLDAARKNTVSSFIFAGLALGAALLTKGTGYIYCFPMGALVFAVYFFNRPSKSEKTRFACQTLLLVMLALVLNAGHFARNYRLFGTPLSTGEDRVANEKLSAPILFSNLVRNYALHLDISTDRTPGLIERAAASLVGAEELKNPDSTYLDIPFAVAYSQHEDLAGNLIHIFLMTGCLGALAFYRGEKKRLVWLSAICTVAGFVLFCAVLRWQPWASRLHLPLFIFGCTFMSVMLARVTPRMAVLIPALCFIGALPALFLGKPRPVIPNDGIESVLTAPRRQQYLANLPELSADFLAVSEEVRQSVLTNPKHQQFAASLPNLNADMVEARAFLENKGAAEVGLFLAVDYKKHKFAEWEYLVWIGLKENFAGRPFIRHVGVRNVSARLAAGQPPPAWIITNGDDQPVEGVVYETAWRRSVLRILRRVE